MRKDIKRKIFGLSLSLLTLTVNIEPCLATSLSFAGMSSNSPGTPGEPTDNFVDWDGDQFGNKRYEYRYQKKITESTEVIMNAYPYYLNGESAIPDDVDEIDDYTFKAGTWVGISVLEHHLVNWYVWDFEYREIRKKYTCYYTKTTYGTCERNEAKMESECSGQFTPYYPDSQWGTCKTTYSCATGTEEIAKDPVTKDYYESYGCSGTYNGYPYSRVEEEEVEVNTINNYSIKNQLKNEAINDARNQARSSVANSSSAIVKYITNNDYPKEESELEFKELQGTLTAAGVSAGTESTYEGDGKQGSFTADFEYLEKNICMNAKTSDVTYGKDCESDEIKIENKSTYDSNLRKTVNYWHYFIPLNTKSDTIFPINIVKNGTRVYSVDQCENFMKEEKPDNYQNYIIAAEDPRNPSANVQFDGSYKRRGKNSTDYDLLEERGGCQIAVTINFPVSQEFYKEIKEGSDLKFQGFNFFYKPIDPNNFSTSDIVSPSIWDDWSGSDPDISSSFSGGTTYETEVISGNKAREIRNYNKQADHVYTSWQSINLQGTSDYIGSGGVIRRTNPESYYKLGCGAGNADSSNKMLYIDGCEDKT